MRARKGTSLLARKAGEVKRYRQEKKIVPLVMLCLGLVTVIVYVISLLYTRFGSFTIGVNKYHSLNYGLSLSDNKGLSNQTSNLNCRASQVITNIDGKSLDDIPLGVNDGVDNGENYLCYTFYCVNSGKEVVDFEYSINIVKMTMNIENAVRIREYSQLNDGARTKVDYAAPKGIVEETGEVIPEEGTTPFKDKSVVFLKTVKDFKPNEVMKYTIVIWLEGNDPDCVDNIIGGEFKVDMKFNVISYCEQKLN